MKRHNDTAVQQRRREGGPKGRPTQPSRCNSGLASALWSIPRDRGRPCVFECRPIDLERREIFKVECQKTELAKLVVQVGLVVLENRTTVVLLKLSNRVAVVTDFEVPRRQSPRVVLIPARLVPPTFE